MIRATIGILAGTGRKPVALAATGVGETSFTANWEAFEGAVYYLLDVSTQQDFSTFVYENEIIYAPTTSYVVIGLEDNTTYYYRLRASTEPLYLLDEWQYPDAAAAYSLRKLRHEYKGAAVEVRNDGGVHLDIGFDENGDLDTAALLAHCGSGDGTVSKWYDQSGDSRDASQTTVANQPQIVSSGSVITENGKPAVEFDGNDVLILSIISYTNISTIAVAKTTSIPSSNAHVVVQSVGVLLKSGQNQNNYPRFQPYDSGYKTAEYQVDSENQQLLLFGYTSSGNAYIYVNNNVGTSASISTLQSPANPFHIGLFPTVPNTSNNGPIQEVIIYPSDQSSNRSGIETNINHKYNIYFDGSYTPLLDTYSGSAAAYSLRLLNSSYTGPLIEVRNDSGVHADIGFTYDGKLNEEALLLHCGSGDGTVSTWYDQSGNGRNATQSTATGQQIIVESGTILTLNSKPIAKGGYNYTVQSPSTHTNISTFTVGQGTTKTNPFSNKQRAAMWTATSPTFRYFYIEDSTISGFPANVVNPNYAYINGSSKSTTLNRDEVATEVDSQSLISLNWNSINSQINRIGYSANDFNLYDLQEIIIYPSDQSSNRTGIETNINDFYNIYYVATNSEYQAVLDYADSQGYQRPSYAQCALQDALVGDLKDAGVWSKLDVFYVFATDGDSDFASINWKDPNNYEITEVNSPTFTTNKGWSTDGTSSYINTNYNFATDSNYYTQNDAGIFLGFSEMDTSGYSGDAFCGTLTTSRFTTIRVDNNSLSSANRLWVNQSAQTNSMFNSKGDNHIYFGNRTSSSDINSRTTQLSTNTTDTQTATQTSTALTNDTLALLRWSSGFMNSLHKMSIFGLSSNLSSTEMDDICTAYYTNYFSNL